MVYNSFTVEILSMSIALLAILFNATSLSLVLTLLKNKQTQSLKTGFQLILLVAIYDLIGPIIGLIQGITIRVLDYNILQETIICQCLGTIESLVPYLSTGAVALLSLERYLFIHQKLISRKWFFIAILSHFLFGLILAITSGIQQQYTMASNRMLCMVHPYSSKVGIIWYYTLIISLILHTIIILFCYIKISLLRKQLTQPMQLILNEVSTTLNPNKTIKLHFIHHHENLMKDQLIPSSPITTNNNNNNNNNNTSTILNQFNNKSPFLIHYKPFKFVLKSLIIILCYLLCILPALSILIYHSILNLNGNNNILDPTLSALMFLPLFSIALINPILLIFLHTRVSGLLADIFKDIFNKC